IHEKPGKILLGPGLGRDPSTVAFVHDLLDGETGDLLIDADGLWALAQQDKWNKPDDANWILTPHPGELANLLDAEIPSDADRLTLVRDLCVEKKITVVSKGYPVIVGTASGNCYLTGYDTRMFARAGFGDILAGKIGAFWIMTGESVTGSFIGLLDGKRKAENLKKQYPNVTPEPLDLV
ncbi:MAG: ADP/ATP-dependent (S)-NAD(P)H-hydrate dehydratase, partial [Balneolaceae bacterium]|nr:ADP/ATP-dependent (S)-NAD(P)H-hydrate dehydratase [Balneolaceae bacterium]